MTSKGGPFRSYLKNSESIILCLERIAKPLPTNPLRSVSESLKARRKDGRIEVDRVWIYMTQISLNQIKIAIEP